MNTSGEGILFTKMHGNGNDFLIIDNRLGEILAMNSRILRFASAEGGRPSVGTG
jgi:diaminopimelate epimerase